MQSVYDKLHDFAMVLADHDTDLAEEFRNFMRGEVITGTDGGNRPTYAKIPYLLRSMVYVDPDTSVSKHGSFSMAMPAIIEKEDDILYLRVLNSAGVPEDKLKRIADWQLPEGGQAGVSSGQGGVLVVGTEIDTNEKIFITSGSLALIADHRGDDHTAGSSIVSDLTIDNEIGLQSLLSKAFWISRTPSQVDNERRNVIALNSYSEGARSGHGVEHQGGAIVLYNSNVRTSSGSDNPRAVSWSAWLDDGPYFEGKGLADEHLKGVDADGVPHLPLMFKKEQTKFGHGPNNYPSAPIDFLEVFAVTPRYSTHIYRAEITYDRALNHPNPSGLVDPVTGRWVVEYRLPHSTPFDEPQAKDVIDTQAKKDPATTKTPIDRDTQKKDTQKKDSQKKRPPPPTTPEPDPKPRRPITREPEPKKQGTPSDTSGPSNADGGGVGSCGHEGTPSKPSGPAVGPVDGVGKDDPASDVGDDSGVVTQDAQSKKQAALKKARRAKEEAIENLASAFRFDTEQANIGGNTIAEIASEAAHITLRASDRKPMFSHLAVAYPTVQFLVPAQEDNFGYDVQLSEDELRKVQNYPINSTVLQSFGNQLREFIDESNEHQTVAGGMIVAGSDISNSDIYNDDIVSAFEAILALRKEGSIQFGTPNIDGTIESPVIFKDDRANNEMVITRRNDFNGEVNDRDYPIHFKVPVRITNLLTNERTGILATAGMIVWDTDLQKPFIYTGTEWQEYNIGSISQRSKIVARSETDFLAAGITHGDYSIIAAGTGAGTKFSGPLDKTNHSGVLSLGTGSTASGRVFVLSGSSNGFHFGEGMVTKFGDILFTPPAASTALEEYVIRAGVFSISLPNTIVNGIGFAYDRNVFGGNWQMITVDSADGGTTSTDSGVAFATSSWFNFDVIVNAAATLVTFFIDGVQVGTQSTASTIPNGTGINSFNNTHIMKFIGTTDTIFVMDYKYFEQEVIR